MKEIEERVKAFRNERNWRQFHNEKDLAISINLEAAELLELFQWKASEKVLETKEEELKDELADILIYAIMLADNLELDIEAIINHKLDKNAEKYPIDKSFNNSKKYTEL